MGQKKEIVSSCCESTVHFVPPSLGDPGLYVCSKCNTFCEPKLMERESYTTIKKGVHRKK